MLHPTIYRKTYVDLGLDAINIIIGIFTAMYLRNITYTFSIFPYGLIVSREKYRYYNNI